MDFTPEDMEAVQSCLEEIDRNVPVAVERALPSYYPNMVPTVADILKLPAWPSEQVRIVARRRSEHRADTLMPAGEPSGWAMNARPSKDARRRKTVAWMSIAGAFIRHPRRK
jgi:hypothetical protein